MCELVLESKKIQQIVNNYNYYIHLEDKDTRRRELHVRGWGLVYDNIFTTVIDMKMFDINELCVILMSPKMLRKIIKN